MLGVYTHTGPRPKQLILKDLLVVYLAITYKRRNAGIDYVIVYVS